MGDFFSTVAKPGGLFQRLSGAEGIEADAKSRQNIANFNAEVAKKEALAIRRSTEFKSKRQAEEAARTKSTQKANIAAAGGTGSPVAEDLAAEQATELELENILLSFEGEVAVSEAERQSALDTAEGKITRQRGRNQALAADVSLGKSLLTGF
jgi:hypothetical protein